MIRSLRTRLVVGTTLAMLLVYSLAALLLYGAIRHDLLAGFDSALLSKGLALELLVETGDQGYKLEVTPGMFGPTQAGDGFLLRSHDGTIIAHDQSFNLDDWSSIPSDPANAAFGYARLPGTPPVRFVVLHFVPNEDDEHPRPPNTPPLTLLVTGNAQPLQNKLHQLAWLLAGVFALTTLISAAIMLGVIRHGLRPLGILAHRISNLGENDLSQRIDLRDAPQETQPVVQRLNELLARLDASFARERAFTADVAHELRTPLAGLTTALQVCASQPRAPEEYQRTMTQCLKVSRSIRLMVENLLTLARADARQLCPARLPLDLDALLKDTWHEFSSRAHAKRLQVEWSLKPQISLHTDPGLLAVVLRNLFDNALTYADDGGSFHIESQPDPHGVVLRISNTGSQVDVQDVPKVFDRFWRSDTARTATGDHCGLGLALCQRIAVLLGGAIEAQSTLGGVFSITLRLPVSPAAQLPLSASPCPPAS